MAKKLMKKFLFYAIINLLLWLIVNKLMFT